MQLQETLAAQDACDAVWWGVAMGCACRWFIVDDVDMLEDDLQLLKSLFEAEGEGLSKPQIEELCAPLAGLLVTMQLDTGILMSNFKQVGLPLLPADVIASRKGCQRRRLCCHASQILHGPAETLDTFKNQSFFPALQISAVELCTSRLLGGCRVKLLSGNMQATSKGRGQDPIIDPLGPANNPQTIVAILAHRADRSASKFLKKELSMPKTAEDSPKSMASFGTAAISFSRFKAKITRRH